MSRKRVEVIEGIVDICYNVVVARSLGAQQITLSDECQDTLGLLGPAAERLNGRPTIPAEGAMPHPNLQAVGMAELVKVLHKTTVEERR